MSWRVLIIHYTPPGIIGGAEHVIHRHIEFLRRGGFEVEVVAGRGDGATTPVHVIPEINVASALNQRIERELGDGVVSPAFFAARNCIKSVLSPLAEMADVIITHNAFTLHFCLPLTSALWELSASRTGGMIAWSHDLSWSNPLYQPAMRPGWPWDLLRLPAPGAVYVTVSDERKTELQDLWDSSGPDIRVVPNGIDPAEFLRLSDETMDLVRRYRLFDRDLVLLLPVRITRRKNIEAGIRAVRTLKDRGLDLRFIITGPVAPHHPGRSRTYLDELKALRMDLDLEQEVVFVADDVGRNLAVGTVAELYAVSDVLLFPTAQEGFGLPVLEAGLARVPAVLSDIPILREVSGGDGWFAAPDGSPDRIAEMVEAAAASGPARLYRRVLRRFRWDVVANQQLIPLVEAVAASGRREVRGE